MGERTSLVAASAALGLSLAAVKVPSLHGLDRRAGAMVARPLGRTGDVVISAGTDLGSVYSVAGSTVALLAMRHPRTAVDVAGSGAIAWIAAQGLKPLVDRQRPYQALGADRLVSEPSGSSWPSGHTAVAAAVASALTPQLPRRATPVAAGLTGFVALSRIYVGVHYLTDVVAGLGVGIVSAKLWRAVRGRFRA